MTTTNDYADQAEFDALENELAAALERSQITFLPVQDRGPWHYVSVLAPSGDLLGRIYHCDRTCKFEVVGLDDIIVAVTDDDDTIMLAAEVVTNLAAARRDANFVNFSTLVDAVEVAFTTTNA